jgi:hypothetical protein
VTLMAEAIERLLFDDDVNRNGRQKANAETESRCSL